MFFVSKYCKNITSPTVRYFDDCNSEASQITYSKSYLYEACLFTATRFNTHALELSSGRLVPVVEGPGYDWNR